MAAGTAGAVVIVIFGFFVSKIVFDQVYKNRKGTVRFALLRDHPILAAGTAGAVVILILGSFFQKSLPI